MEIDSTDSNFMQYVKYGFSLLKDLRKYYEISSIEIKQKILSSIFPGKLIFEDNKCRTPKVNKVLKLLTSNINELGEIKKGKKSVSEKLYLRASPRGGIRYHHKW